VKRAVLDRLLQARAARESVALVTRVESGQQAIWTKLCGLESDLFEGEIPDEAGTMLRDGESGVSATSRGEVFVRVFTPPLRLVIVGGVHITQALAPMAALAGYAVTVIDPRKTFASPDRFPGVEIVNAWPDEALRRLDPDEGMAIVTLSHDPKLDDPALEAALRSPAFYIGSLGSRRTQVLRRARLSAAGSSAEEIARVHGPVGLDLGALSPAEIAIAIMAEVTQVRRRPRTAPHHGPSG
jgi:xanthine dehydrogenase accessory factor